MSTSNVWYAIPSARAANDQPHLMNWHTRGYRIAVQQDPDTAPVACADLVYARPYQGYTRAVNFLCREILKTFPSTSVIVTGGDDIDPDPITAPDVVEQQFVEHFNGTFGVMQPTGDRWMVDQQGRGCNERVCGSPWMGRQWCEKMYGGAGPLWPGWFHFYEDEELQEVALKMDVLWQRSDLTQYHHHWQREGRKRPVYLSDARLDWASAKKLFLERQAAGFPGHEPLGDIWDVKARRFVPTFHEHLGGRHA